MPLYFNETVTSHEINVVIINDGVRELREHFLAVLTLVDPLLPDKITIRPAVANVTIVDGKHSFIKNFDCNFILGE